MRRIMLVLFAVILVSFIGNGLADADDDDKNFTLFSPDLMASSFNLNIGNYYEEFTGESSMGTTVYNDLYLRKDYVNSDNTKVVYANTFKTFTLTFYCENEFSWAEDVLIYADTSSLNKWTTLPIIMYAALVDDMCIDPEYGYTTNVYAWAHDGNHYSPYYADSFAAKYTASGFKHTVEMIATKHLTYQYKAKAPTETTPGWKYLWGCWSCSRIFADPDGLYEIYDPIPIPPLNELSVLYLPDALETIEAEALSNLDCEAIIIPEGCTTIGEMAFSNCKNLLYVNIPTTVTSIGYDAFSGCDNVTVIFDEE